MPNRQRDKGHRAEREVCALLRDALQDTAIRPRLQEGRADDIGDVEGVPGWTLQVRNYADPQRAIRDGLPALRHQQRLGRTPFGALLVRRRRQAGQLPHECWLAVMDLDQLVALVRALADDDNEATA